jgi:hypothetical protein
MERIRHLGRGERIVLVVALGVALDAFCSYFVPLATFPYASTAQLSIPSSGPPGWFRVIVWFVVAGAWAVGSIAILRASPSDPPHEN